MRIVRWMLLGPLVLAVIIFSVANRQPVEVKLTPLPWEFSAPLYLLLLAALFLGFVIGFIGLRLSRISLPRVRLRKRQKSSWRHSKV